MSNKGAEKMDPKTRAIFEARATVAKALAHPTRLFLIETLALRQRCVCELTKLVGADISTVSKHLTILKKAGIVESRKRGAEIHYALRVPCILKFFACVEGVLKKNSEEAQKLLRQ